MVTYRFADGLVSVGKVAALKSLSLLSHQMKA